MKKFILVYCCFFFVASSFASVDTVSIYSNAMHRTLKAIVIKPADYDAAKKFPVVYLLHGAYGDYSNWIKKMPGLGNIATLYGMLIVCPDGSDNSWYFDSPVDSSYKFETHVGTEVPEYIDSHYKTIGDRKHRAITGLSMGGHGAMFLAFRHSDIFGACGSMSGVLDINSIKMKYNISKRLGDSVTNIKYYNEGSVLQLIESPLKNSLAIIIDCGLQDIMYGMNKAVHEKLIKLKIPHDYIERPGKHEWSYWINAVQYQLLFFNDFFHKPVNK